MSYTTEGLLLYSKYTDNPIGTAVVEPAKPARSTSTYNEFAQFVTFQIDNTDETKRIFIRWRKPVEGYGYYQFLRIKNNNTGLVTVEFRHINSGLVSNVNSIHAARIGGSIQNGQLQPAGGPLDISVQKNSDRTYAINVSGNNNNNTFSFDFDPDALTEADANEVDFETNL